MNFSPLVSFNIFSVLTKVDGRACEEIHHTIRSLAVTPSPNKRASIKITRRLVKVTQMNIEKHILSVSEENEIFSDFINDFLSTVGFPSRSRLLMMRLSARC